MCESTNARFTARTGAVTISTPNPDRNGNGPITQLISGEQNGTIVRNITVIATGPTTQGMVRLFITDPQQQSRLIYEILVPATTPTDNVRVFKSSVRTSIKLQTGYSIGVATERPETFNVVAIGQDWKYVEPAPTPSA